MPKDETGRRLLRMVGVPLLVLTVVVPLLVIVPERGVVAGLAWVGVLVVVGSLLLAAVRWAIGIVA